MNTEKEQFESPMLEMINFTNNDVIATSPTNYGVDGNLPNAISE